MAEESRWAKEEGPVQQEDTGKEEKHEDTREVTADEPFEEPIREEPLEDLAFLGKRVNGSALIDLESYQLERELSEVLGAPVNRQMRKDMHRSDKTPDTEPDGGAGMVDKDGSRLQGKGRRRPKKEKEKDRKGWKKFLEGFKGKE